MRLLFCKVGITAFLAAIGASGFLAATATTTASAQEAKAAKAASAASPKLLVVSPAASPVPALKYRLIPSVAELNPGDAAPIYLRIRHELNSEAINQIDANEMAWMSLPLDKFPTQEARKFVDGWRARLKQIEYGSRRQFCDWSYTLPEQRLNAIEILLPDAQEMRRWARLLSIQARVQIAEKKYDDAIRTIETGLAFGRHVGSGPFLISALVGMAIEGVMLDRVEELISQPNAPNLYWALTALPRPLVSVRDAMEYEQRLAETMIPELAEMGTAHSAGEWTVLLARMYERLRGLNRQMADLGEASAALKARQGVDLSAFKKEMLKDARAWLVAHDWSKDEIRGMSDDEAVARAFYGQYQALRDAMYKGSYLPFARSKAVAAEAEAESKAAQKGPLAVLAALFPALRTASSAEVRLDRRVAALRAVEAVRLHAAKHKALPQSLAAVSGVPVPDDPASGVPFEYKRDGNAAILYAPLIDDQPNTELTYRIELRK